MKREEIEHLGQLARIKLSDEDVATLQHEIDDILAYVSTVQEITAQAETNGPQFGARFNVLREDVVTNAPDSNTQTLLQEAPERDDRYVVVKRILSK